MQGYHKNMTLFYFKQKRCQNDFKNVQIEFCQEKTIGTKGSVKLKCPRASRGHLLFAYFFSKHFLFFMQTSRRALPFSISRKKRGQ